MTQTVDADAVVAGAGMAGLVTAVDLADRGVDVLVLEKAAEPGGSMRMSNGIVWTYLPYEALRERAPDGDPALQRVLAERFEDDLDWLDSVGADLSEPDFDVEGPGMMIDPPAFTEHMVSRLEAAGGTLRTDTGFESVRTEDGRVVGVDATTPDGERLRVNAEDVVLATGGFQGNEELVERYVTDATQNLYLRSNPESTGDAFLAARDVGAKTTGGLGTFYGHTLAAPPADVRPETFADATQYYGYAAVALDASGERFTDESESPLEETLAQDVASMADGRAFYVFDEHIADDAHGYTTADGILDNADELGGRTARVDTLADLRAVLDEWSANGRRAVETLRAYNRAIRNDRRPDPPRENERYPVDAPPYRVVEVQAAITFTMGGLAVTPDMAVKRRSASRSGMSLVGDEDGGGADGVIPGLYAAGCDVGNVHRRAYVGGLALGLVSGRVAAEHIAE
jgi:succinate dehydrogenase/fumarate reductase flavoprotein subunit